MQLVPARTVISQKKTISREPNNNMVQNPTVAKNNTTKYDFDGTSMKNQIDIKLQIECKTVSYSYVMEAVDSWTILILRASTDFDYDEIYYSSVSY